VAAEGAPLPSPWVTRVNGSVLVTLTTSPSPTPGVHYVTGDIVLASGEFATERTDVRLAAEGMYVAATGELRLLAAHAHVFAEVSGAQKHVCAPVTHTAHVLTCGACACALPG
jgi:hypothetical protein